MSNHETPAATVLLDALDARMAEDADYSPVPTEYLNLSWPEIAEEIQDYEAALHDATVEQRILYGYWN